MTDEQLVTALVPHLVMPKHPVQVSQEHADKIHQENNKDGVQAYAKLAGKDWTFYIKRLKNNIGRPPEGATSAPADAMVGDDMSDGAGEAVHIDLGPSKTISRQHAEIFYDSDRECWNIVVHGRNGIRIDNMPLRPTQSHTLKSGEIIDIGGVEMIFVLPEADRTLKIHRRYLQRAGLVTFEEELPRDPAYDYNAGAFAHGQNGAYGSLAIAPAPPDYRRPGTPLADRSRLAYPAHMSPAFVNGNTILLASDDVDLSLDSNAHIKPSFSYAQMIAQAVFSTDDERLTLNGIYTYIQDKFAYYRHQHGGGWQASIPHAVSISL